MRPAFSSAFKADRLQILESVVPLDDVTPEWAWGGTTGKGVKVAVVDSGVEASHPAIGGRVAGYLEVRQQEGEVLLSEEPHEDAFGHGTACAGIILSIAPDCELYSVKVLGPKGGKGEVFVAGLRWAIESGMQTCNLSLGTSKKEFFGPLHELADLAYFQNVMLVTAANNFPIPSFPCEYASVTSVASHEINDPYLFYYNPKPPVEFGAYGIEVPVAWRGGSTTVVTGNSFAAPHITGLVTRILEKRPSLTVFQMKAVLRALAANLAPSGAVPALHAAGSRPAAGWPRKPAAEAE